MKTFDIKFKDIIIFDELNYLPKKAIKSITDEEDYLFLQNNIRDMCFHRSDVIFEYSVNLPRGSKSPRGIKIKQILKENLISVDWKITEELIENFEFCNPKCEIVKAKRI